MLKVFCVVLVAIILNGCVVQENKATVTTYITPNRNIIGKDLFKRIKGDIKVESAINKHSGRVSDSK